MVASGVALAVFVLVRANSYRKRQNRSKDEQED